uniref:Biofilm and cell wall regulator 1 n=1 Tax=Ganoderma boninense TaxID=34458 RepID=A0A5K1K0M0_9APHY|nr:Biofilm and cell wall regulator 1 [Ganoderma boninense]
MSSISDPRIGFTTNTLTLWSFTISVALAGAKYYSSFCATNNRHQAIIGILDRWENYLGVQNPQDRASFEQTHPGELDRISDAIQLLRRDAATMALELHRHRWWMRYFPWSEVCAEFRIWDQIMQESDADFYCELGLKQRLFHLQLPEMPEVLKGYLG